MTELGIVAVGKLRDGYAKNAVSDYAKRLSRYCAFQIAEVRDFPDDQNSTAREAALILPKIKGICVPLCVEGEQLTSEALAEFLRRHAVEGGSRVTFVIGGSLGLDEKIKSAGRLRLSLSKMTFPHQLARVLLTEQLYRAFKIISGENYHK
ncbi:MAG: 23S rRNA (pseudouridine(1915)-N(3))-methyltransferase RlmH [Clostridiales bacterium]|nr:23S rRNA (pseudouridine(1915)-N(3))-methyltransferase RlmH [Clostridiales bacterium]